MAFRVAFLPGSVLPAQAAYGGLVEVLGADVDALVKDLEVYASPEQPADYTLDCEVDGVLWPDGAEGLAVDCAIRPCPHHASPTANRL